MVAGEAPNGFFFMENTMLMLKTQGWMNLLRAGLVCGVASPLMASAALVVNSTNDVAQLTSALIAPGSGINLSGSSLVLGGATQQVLIPASTWLPAPVRPPHCKCRMVLC